MNIEYWGRLKKLPSHLNVIINAQIFKIFLEIKYFSCVIGIIVESFLIKFDGNDSS